MDSRNSLEIKIQDLAEELRNYEQKLQYLKGIEYDIYTELEALEQDHPQYNQKLQNLQAVRSEINKYDVTKRREQFEDDVAELKRRQNSMSPSNQQYTTTDTNDEIIDSHDDEIPSRRTISFAKQPMRKSSVNDSSRLSMSNRKSSQIDNFSKKSSINSRRSKSSHIDAVSSKRSSVVDRRSRSQVETNSDESEETEKKPFLCTKCKLNLCKVGQKRISTESEAQSEDLPQQRFSTLSDKRFSSQSEKRLSNLSNNRASTMSEKRFSTQSGRQISIQSNTQSERRNSPVIEVNINSIPVDETSNDEFYGNETNESDFPEEPVNIEDLSSHSQMFCESCQSMRDENDHHKASQNTLRAYDGENLPESLQNRLKSNSSAVNESKLSNMNDEYRNRSQQISSISHANSKECDENECERSSSMKSNHNHFTLQNSQIHSVYEDDVVDLASHSDEQNDSMIAENPSFQETQITKVSTIVDHNKQRETLMSQGNLWIINSNNTEEETEAEEPRKSSRNEQKDTFDEIKHKTIVIPNAEIVIRPKSSISFIDNEPQRKSTVLSERTKSSPRVTITSNDNLPSNIRVSQNSKISSATLSKQSSKSNRVSQPSQSTRSTRSSQQMPRISEDAPRMSNNSNRSKSKVEIPSLRSSLAPVKISNSTRKSSISPRNSLQPRVSEIIASAASMIEEVRRSSIEQEKEIPIENSAATMHRESKKFSVQPKISSVESTEIEDNEKRKTSLTTLALLKKHEIQNEIERRNANITELERRLSQSMNREEYERLRSLLETEKSLLRKSIKTAILEQRKIPSQKWEAITINVNLNDQ